MKATTFVLFILAGLVTSSCSQSKTERLERRISVDLKSQISDTSNRTETIIPNKELEVKLKREKYFIDTLASDTDALIVLVKLSDKRDLVQVTDDQWPDGIETFYNIRKDKNGKIRYFVEIPFSESGDWFIAYKSYFDIEGHLIAFQKETNFFNSECTNEAAYEVSLKYYDRQFQLIDSVYTLTDLNKKPLKRSSCFFPYEFPFKIYRTVEILKKGIDINGY